MRAGWAAALLLLTLAVTACARPADQLAVAADGDTPPDRPTLVVCATILGTMSNAIREGRATGDRAAITAAMNAYAKKAALRLGDVESRQAIGSSYAFYDSLTPAQLSAASALCLNAVDQDFSDQADWW